MIITLMQLLLNYLKEAQNKKITNENSNKALTTEVRNKLKFTETKTNTLRI